MKGTVELTVSTREISGQKRFNFFTFTASNGLAGKAPFSDKFTWTRLNSKFCSFNFGEKKKKEIFKSDFPKLSDSMFCQIID